MVQRASLYAILVAALASSCSGSTLASSNVIPLSQVERVEVEVDYAPSAEPFVGGAQRISDVWSVTRSNMQRVFKGKVVVVPNTLAAMEVIHDAPASPYSVQAILGIAEKHRGVKSQGSSLGFYVVFLNGYLKDDTTGKAMEDVLGVSIGDTGVVAMFKPVIQSAATGGPLGASVVNFVEQSTLTHELGHSIGLVNRSVPMAAAHQDAEHGAHCTNTQCVMYWENEGAAAARQFIQRYISTGVEILFGEECLKDTDAAQTK